MRLATPLTFMIELLAAIPSVVIGLWGVFILAPFLRGTVEAWIVSVFGWIPFLGGPAYGIGLFSAGVILTIMILPTIVTISREVIGAVPGSQREAMVALGATRWETIRRAVIPFARSGIIGAVILGLGRALGETMAVTMVIGNKDAIPNSLFDQTQTIASKIATSFSEATVGIQTSSLIALGLVLLVMTIIMNVIARLLVWRVRRPRGGRVMAATTPSVRTGRLTGTRAANRRTWTDRIMRSVAALSAVACVVPLAAVLIFVTINGLAALNLDLLTQAEPGRSGIGGGVAGRDPRDDPDGRAGDAHRDPVRRAGRGLRQRVQLEPIGAWHPVCRRRAGRRAVDPGGRLRLHLPRPAVQAVQRASPGASRWRSS